ncbi:MAG: helix-turn-helix domain-containing protein [Oscillibacter sp.]|nr:helix-turn-helix domain-containing protein [Oscillibacter sp.]
MQMQILSTAAMAGLGQVLSAGEDPRGTPRSLQFLSSAAIKQFQAKKEVVVDYESGMSALILYSPQTQIFYLDRTVQLSPGVLFSIVPLGDSCTVRIFLQYGDELADMGSPEDDTLLNSAPSLHITRIYTCFYQESARDFYFRGERHTPYELTYVDKGSLHNLVNGTDVVLHQGEMVIVGREDWHMQYSDEQVSFLTVTFDLNGDFLQRITGKPLPLPAGARDPLKRFLSERNREQSFSYDYMESLLKIMLIELLRADSVSHTPRTAALPSTARAENRIVDQALQIISQRSHQPPNLKELAAAVHVSVPYLCRLFDNHVGIPPGQYITKIRLEECKALLRQGELSMNAIALRMGFSSAQQFSRQFKHYCGLTPTEYTRSLR